MNTFLIIILFCLCLCPFCVRVLYPPAIPIFLICFIIFFIVNYWSTNSLSPFLLYLTTTRNVHVHSLYLPKLLLIHDLSGLRRTGGSECESAHSKYFQNRWCHYGKWLTLHYFYYFLVNYFCLHFYATNSSVHFPVSHNAIVVALILKIQITIYAFNKTLKFYCFTWLVLISFVNFTYLT